MLEFSVPVPPLEEQRRIAEILDTIDETIDTTERLIAKRKLARTAMRSALLPRSVDEGDVELRDLGTLIDPRRPVVYGILMPHEHVHGGVPVVKVKDIQDDSIAPRSELLHTSREIDRQYGRSRVRSGDVLFTIRGQSDVRALCPTNSREANITQDTVRLAPSDVDPEYFRAALGADSFMRYIDVHTIGQAVKGINLRELRKAPVLVPSPDRQGRIGGLLKKSGEQIDAEQARLDKLRTTRAGLAADLLTGRVRTVDT